MTPGGRPRPLVMGVVNVTPDSFSDGGRYLEPAQAIEHGLELLADGADILDIGGESTRPGATRPLVAEELARVVPVIERLAQNLFICASTVSQHAALACFEPESLALYEQRRAEFKARRDFVIPELNAMGLTVPVVPDGAFYAWADCSAACARLGLPDSWAFAHEALHQAHVAITPGRDFGSAETAQFVRFSTANSMQELQTAMQRLRQWLQP